MAFPNPTFIVGVIVLAYLATFIAFAIIRVWTGISIQRLGLSSLRRIAYTPKDGTKIEIRGLGLNLHRPTFAQPTWISVVLTELAITIDLNTLEKTAETEECNGEVEEEPPSPGSEFEPTRKPSRRTSWKSSRSKSWEHLTSVKERIKRLHRNINWIRMLDVVATNSTVTVVDVGQIQVGSFTMAVDTRRKMVDRARLFLHRKPAPDQRPAEWMFTVRSVLFTPDGRESLEVLDHASLDIHGLLFKSLDGLRDAAISLKLGRIHIPYDDVTTCIDRYKSCKKTHNIPDLKSDFGEIGMADLIEELEQPGSRDEKLVQTVSDSKEFVGSVLRGVKEVQFAVSYIGFTKSVPSIQPHGQPLYLNASMKEVGVDLHRLDPKSPAHRMYFSAKDIAHQALAAALSIGVSVDDGHGKADRLMYIPMATTTVRTTLPSKTVEFAGDSSADERNTNIMFTNVVITSPSVDLDPRHLPIVLALLHSKPKVTKEPLPRRSHHLISRLLPKTNVKFSMHEPVLRIALPPVEKDAQEDDFDLIISSISSISLDIESSHSAEGQLHYSIGSSLRLQSHDLYYQTSSGLRYDLLETESMELKVHVSANPEVYVMATCNLQTFSIHMVRSEISEGVRQIVRQLRLNVQPEKTKYKATKDPNFIRAMPSWLIHFQLQGSDFSAEVAGVDHDISPETRGLALQLDSWAAEYLAQRVDSNATDRRLSRRRTNSRSLAPDPDILNKMPGSPRRKPKGQPTDGRRLTVHVGGLEGFVVESSEKWEPEPFLAMPRCEVALSTTSDTQGPIFHVNSTVKTLLIRYSLYRHYSFGIAAAVLKTAFVRTKADREEAEKAHAVRTLGRGYLSPSQLPKILHSSKEVEVREMVTADFRLTLLQIKASMPADPPTMLQIYGVEVGRHRFSAPFFHAKLARLYAEAPKMRRIWARIVSIKFLRVDFRDTRRMFHTGELVEEKLIDVNTEAIRLGIPHQLILHKVIDNFINTVKSVEQLHHRFFTGTNDYILEKRPEGPKHVPKVSIRSKALLFELEDGAFEWKLGNIYRTGLIEQKQRLAREEAFKVKAKRITEEELRKDSNRFRNRSAHPRGRSNHTAADSSRQRSKSEDSSNRHRSQSSRGRRMRYDPEGTCGLSGTAKITIEEALEKLQHHNSQSWKSRIDTVYSQSTQKMSEIRGVFWGPDELPDDMEEENILQVPDRPGLMATLISDLRVMIDKPSFPISKLPEYLHKMGKGMPLDTKYSLLIPMNLQIDMGEARVALRDYPLPLLHVPPIKAGQSSKLPAWSLKTDFIIAEEFRGPESTRHVKVNIVPPSDSAAGQPKDRGFAIDVRRTVSPVKTYSDIKIDINTSLPTRITWGASYQPAIQDMMMTIETFTKPQIDPSDRAGFWDKIRLVFHSKVSVAWKGDGDVHLVLKGTRDPYMITGNGAGLLMCWRNDVRWNICRDEDPRRFMTVDSGEYILAVPDFSHQACASDPQDRGRDNDSMISQGSFRHGAIFKKVAMKLSGNVQWVAGIMFERDTKVEGKRLFDFEPHYNVVLKEPKYAKSTPDHPYDAFKGFRSNHIHLSIAVKAPVDREWNVSNMQPSKSYNTVHLTPRFFTHFFAWWSMFGGTMSLPIRQGTLWPGLEKSSKKFGRHLATIKYSLLLAPLFLSHVYKHKDAEDYAEDVVSATGLKMRLDSFMLDVHQRREQFHTQDKGKNTQGKTSAMKMHEAQLDLLSADIRAVSASIAGTTPEDLQKASSPLNAQQEPAALDLSHFEIPDNDFSWIDMDDFVELDWILPSEANPETKIMPLAYAPRFTYFRQTDHGNGINGDPDRTSCFGNEPTHFCTMTKDDDPRRVQCELIQRRLDQLQHQMKCHKRNVGEAELRYIQDEHNPTLKEDVNHMHQHTHVLRDKKIFLESMMHRMSTRMNLDKNAALEAEHGAHHDGGHSPSEETMDSSAGPDFASDFNNRFVIHNMQMKWNNLLRNIILRYIHQVSQRRGFVYYLSRRAVKFILDIVEEQNKAKSAKSSPSNGNGTRSTSTSTSPINDDGNALQEVEAMIHEILSDGKNFVSANDEINPDPPMPVPAENLDSNISEEFIPWNSYHLRLIAPQIQLQSEKNPKDAALVTAKGMELKVVEVMDKNRIYDDVSGLVQRRFSVEMDSTQFFVTHQKWFSSQLLSLYSGSHYGTPAGSSWPPWVPMEVIFDFKVESFGFQRVVQKTSASLRYDKYNTLRLKYGEDVNSEGGNSTSNPQSVECRMDHLWVEFPQVRAICDSSQYYALYIIVLDLLMYSEPLEKTRSERLEKIMLASDFSDLRGAPEMVICLQERIRQLDEIKTQFQINSRYLDQRGWEDRLMLDKDLTSCEDELFFMMKAITTSQRKYDGSQSSGLLRWNISSEQIVWHLIRDNNEPLMEFQLQNAEYDRTDNSDGSHINLMQVGKLIGLNLLPDAIYPEMIGPYSDAERGAFSEGGNQQMMRVYWYMLEAIAGIPVMDHFEVNLFPMKIQLEREVGKKLFEYIFPDSKDEKHGHSKNKSPFMVKHTSLGEGTDEGYGSESVTIKEKDGSGRSGSLELRLKPTMNSEQRSNIATNVRTKPASLHSGFGPESHRFKLFSANDRSSTGSTRTSSPKRLSKRASTDSLQSSLLSRSSIGRSSTNYSNTDAASTVSGGKRFNIGRTNSKKKEKASDDLTKMMDRASNYMTLAYVKIPSVVLCLSYKGKGERNIEDVHDFVFRLPMIEYRNKTWSNLDLALALKKDVIRALISHTGAIIGNKFSKHRPNATQQHRLRELATSSTLLTPTHYDSSNDNSDASTFASSPVDGRPSEPRHSFASSLRPSTASNSVRSLQSVGRSQTFASNLSMTPMSKGDKASLAGSDISNQNGKGATDDDKHGFVVNTLHRLKKSHTQHGSIIGPADDKKEDSEDGSSTRRKSKLLLGKKLLSSLSDR